MQAAVPPPTPWVDDTTLLGQVGHGDRGALAELYRRHAGWLTARLSRRCADPELVDIALQDTFVAVWRKPGSFRGDGEVGAWLWGIAVRRLIDQLRKRVPEPVDTASVSAEAAGGLAPSAERRMLDGDFQAGALGQAFGYLAPELQAVLVATAIDGLTTKEAAALLGIPQGTVKTRLSRARTQLADLLRQAHPQGGYA